MLLDLIGEIFFYGIFGTPLLGWLLIRHKTHMPVWEKIVVILCIAFVLSAIFFLIAMTILIRNGLGPG
mgnify:CR=1 FL=1